MSATTVRVTESEFKKTLGLFATGVTILTVLEPDNHVHGMTATAFASVSLDPLLVLVCIDHRAHTLSLLKRGGRFGVNVLAEDQRSLAIYFAQVEQNAETAERLGIEYENAESGTRLLRGSLAQMDCRVMNSFEAGDHTIFLGQVEEVRFRAGTPLIHFSGQYHGLGKTVAG